MFKRAEKQLQVKQAQARKMAQQVVDTQEARDRVKDQLDHLRLMSDQERESFGVAVGDTAHVSDTRSPTGVYFWVPDLWRLSSDSVVSRGSSENFDFVLAGAESGHASARTDAQSVGVFVARGHCCVHLV